MTKNEIDQFELTNHIVEYIHEVEKKKRILFAFTKVIKNTTMHNNVLLITFVNAKSFFFLSTAEARSSV